MIHMGKCFAAPPRQDEREWKKLEWMVANGWNGRNWPVRPSMNLAEVRSALRAWRETVATAKRKERVRRSLAKLGRRPAMSQRMQFRAELKRQRRYQDGVLSALGKLPEDPT